MAIYKNTVSFLSVAGISLLSACGGSGGGGTTTPVPTPPATDLTGLFSSAEDKTFTSNSTVLSLNGATTSNSSSTSEQVIYNGTDKSLQVNVTSQGGVNFNVTFGQNEINSGLSGGSKTVYEDSSGAIFTIHKVGSAGSINIPGTNPQQQISLQYSSFGLWLLESSATEVDAGYISFGFKTASADMPTSGTATYLGYAEGTLFYNPGGVTTGFLITGKVDVTANFAGGGSVTTLFRDMSTVPSASPNDTPTPWRNFDVVGTLSGNSFSGSASNITGGGSMSGSLNGSFFGPVSGGGPAEVGGTWQIQGGDEKAIGAFVGVRQ